MTPRLTAPALFLPLLLAMLLGCEQRRTVDYEAIEDLARAAGEDVARLKFAVEDMSETAGELAEDGADETATECYTTLGDCSVCYSLDGSYLAGSFTAVTTPEPCSAEWTVRNSSATYAVMESGLAGTWSAESLAGDYTVGMTGSRNATLTTTTRDGVTPRTPDWTLTERTATTTNFEVSVLAMELTYTGFAEHTWSLSATGDSAGPQGSLLIDDGSVNCSIGGDWETLSLSCL